MAEPLDHLDFFSRLEHERTRALVTRDMPTLERLHAPEYELVTPTGRVFSREAYLGLIATEPFYADWAHESIRVRVMTGMAILRYLATLSFPSGRIVRCWHTDSYENREGRWQAVWSQATSLPVEPTAPAAPATS